MRRKAKIQSEDVAKAILAEAKADAAEQIQNDFDRGAERTESPIERILLAQLLHPEIARNFDERVELMLPPSGLVANAVPPPFPGIYIYPQITIGSYRVDFFLCHVGFGDEVPLIVECDGHDFHEKTKEQAQRDKARDRYLVGQGYRVLRFTGSEIYRSPVDVAEEIISVLLRIA